MHHRTFLFTAYFLGGASLAAAESSTSTSTATSTSTSKKPPVDNQQIPTAWPISPKSRKSHINDPENIAYPQLNDDQEFSKDTDDTEAEPRERWGNDRDVDLDAYVTILPSSVQSLGSLYVQEASNAIQALIAPESKMPTTTTTMAMEETKTSTTTSNGMGTGSSTATNTDSKASRHKTTAMETISIYPTKEPSTALTTLLPNLTMAPLSLRRSSSLSLPSPSPASNPDTIGTIAPSPSISSDTRPNAAPPSTARQAMAGVLGKAAGAFVLAVVGFVVLL